MWRKIYDDLLEWKNNKDSKKPLLIFGARQVGKTYIVNEFCKNEYDSFKEINLLEHQEIVELFKKKKNLDEIYLEFKSLIDFDFDKENSILFIDEVQKSPELISALKFFCERHNNVNIVCAGSLLGVMIRKKHISYPVGKIWTLNMYPMNFEEFLIAHDRKDLIDLIKEHYASNNPMSEPLHEKLMLYYKYYMISGGMPEAVSNMINSGGDLFKYNDKIITEIIESYFEDMNQYVDTGTEAMRIKNIYNSIAPQLSNQSHKFQYSKVEKNAKTREYESPLDWLLASRLILKCELTKLPEIPPKAYVDSSTFKIFMNDIGILCKMLRLSPNDILTENISSYIGVIAENYVACELKQNNTDLLYWCSSAYAEVDFIIYNDDGVIPIEVKSGNNTQAKSLKIYMDKYNPKYAIRVSSKNFGFNNNIKSIPLYAVFCIK